MIISLVAAMSENRVIGRDNQVPWHLPDDLKRFRELTIGHTVVMGRRTYESIGKSLPQRKCVVLSRQAEYRLPQVQVVRSWQQALAVGADQEELFVVGGADIYTLALCAADRIYLTVVHAHVAGNTYFPALDLEQWQAVCSKFHPADKQHAYAFTFTDYTRLGKR